ncbi:MAG: hypothetical protein QM736_19545 [Vicinamibacterales bacterium]
MTAIEMRAVAEPFIRRRADPSPRERSRRRSSAAGTGNPYFTPIPPPRSARWK